MELKLNELFYGRNIGTTLNCTLVELKLLVRSSCNTSVYSSKLYLSGIEMHTVIRFLKMLEPLNCTLVELKCSGLYELLIASNISKLYLSGIEMHYAPLPP